MNLSSSTSFSSSIFPFFFFFKSNKNEIFEGDKFGVPLRRKEDKVKVVVNTSIAHHSKLLLRTFPKQRR